MTNLTQIPLALGGNTFGWSSDEATSFKVLDAFVAAGGKMIDSADVYSNWGEGNSGGESETVIGNWLRARGGERDDVTIVTKVGMLEPLNNQREETVREALDKSLERLGVDYVDLYYAHLDDEETPIEDQARTYDALVKEGKIKAIGISNYSPERMRAWFEFAKGEGLTLPVAVQVQYNLVHRAEFENEFQPLAKEFGAATYTFFALASGFLTGKYRSADDLKGAAREGFLGGYATDEGFKVVDALVEVAREHDAEPTAVALAW